MIQLACMQNMLLLGEAGGMPPQKIFEISCSEIESKGNFLPLGSLLMKLGSTAAFPGFS